ncbi:MAG TPA: helix-turn-helix domain-containing protein [Gemmatimonadales bacterium]|nr:helix-turn-helix domain-containing protein [Gemmatimonadales bacterium]
MSTPAVPILLASPRARVALRRALPRGRVRLVRCRSGRQVARTLATSLADAVIVDARLPEARALLLELRANYPGVPRFAYSAFRADDAELLRDCGANSLAVPIVEGVEDAVLPDLVLPDTASARRAQLLAAAPRLLRLSEDLQRQVWNAVLFGVAGRLRALDLARSLGVSREHLSRQFGAGGAPNLKRVIDLARAATAADLLANPGYTARGVARILGFASASHLTGVARRIAGVTARGLAALGPAGVLAEFARGRMRSRSRPSGE